MKNGTSIPVARANNAALLSSLDIISATSIKRLYIHEVTFPLGHKTSTASLCRFSCLQKHMGRLAAIDLTLNINSEMGTFHHRHATSRTYGFTAYHLSQMDGWIMYQMVPSVLPHSITYRRCFDWSVGLRSHLVQENVLLTDRVESWLVTKLLKREETRMNLFPIATC